MKMRNYAKKRRIKRHILSIAILSLIGYGLFVYFDFYSDPSNIVAKIGDEKISENEIKRKFQDFLSSNGSTAAIPPIEKLPKEVIESISKEIYFERKLVKKAKSSKIAQEKAVKEKIKSAKNQILIDSYLDSKISENIAEEKIKQKYLELSNKVQGKREFLIYHIVVDSENRAQWIYRKYNETSPSQKPKTFSKLAKEYSIDQESANNDGKLGYILEDNLIKEIADEIGSYKKPDYTKPIKTEFGWHIVLVKNIRDAEILPFEEAYENIKNQIIRDTTNEIYSEIFSDNEVSILIDLKEGDSTTDKENGKKE